MLFSVGDTLGPYEIQAHIGEGAMGVVYRARDTRLHRMVALKVLPFDQAGDAGLRRRLLQEARAASVLNHPNVVVLYDIARDGEVDFLVMEYVSGKTLHERVIDGGLSPTEISEYGAQIAGALAAAHAVGMVHRDIKPSNLMITAESQVKVLDFGVAKLAEGAKTSTHADTLTNEAAIVRGTFIGTVAPELCTRFDLRHVR